MLTHVAHEKHAHVVLLCHPEERRSLAIGLQSCLIADHYRVLQPALLLRVAQEIFNGRRLAKPLVSQDPRRRCRGRDGEDGVTGFTQSALHFLECRGFPGSRDAAKAKYPILCAENCGNGLLLFLGEMRGWNKTGIQRRAGILGVVNVFHCLLFQLQALRRATF